MGQEGALPRNKPVPTVSESGEDRRLMTAADKRGEDPKNNGGGGGWSRWSQRPPAEKLNKQTTSLHGAN